MLHTKSNNLVKQTIIDSHARLKAEGFYQDEQKPPSVLNNEMPCSEEGFISLGDDKYDCLGVDFFSFLSLNDLEIEKEGLEHSFDLRSADIWGWLSPTNREFTILAMDNGVVVVDSTEPSNPCIIAKMPTGRPVDIWADVKVIGDTLYHVKDNRIRDADPNSNGTHGIEVYDLLPLDEIDCHAEDFDIAEQDFVDPDYVVPDHGRSHNLVANPESGLLYSVGTEKCEGGLMIFDTNVDRLQPPQVGCVFQDGYSHDAQCVTYDGPDPNYQGNEICFGFNEDTLTIIDVTDPANPVIVSRTEYPNQVYSHQGWTNDDLTKILLDDELDELCNMDIEGSGACGVFPLSPLSGLLNTSTNVFNIRDLSNPVFEGAYVHKDQSIDHNL